MPTTKMTWEYVAGFFEGEGSVPAWQPRDGRAPRARITIVQKNHPEILFAIQDFLGYGSLTQRQSGLWLLSITGRENVRQFLRGVYPHMFSVRKRKAVRLAYKLAGLTLTVGGTVHLENTNRPMRDKLVEGIRRANGH